MEFDKSKILTAVTADKLIEGQLGWINDRIGWLKSDIQEMKPYQIIKSDDLDLPFDARGRGKRRYFYPAPEPCFKIGDRVEVLSDLTFLKQGTTGRVIDQCQHSHLARVMVDGRGEWGIQKSSLKVITEPTYRPYTDAELNDLVGEVLTNKKSGCHVLVTRKPRTQGNIMLDGSAINATQLLESFYRNDTEPCGIEEK